MSDWTNQSVLPDPLITITPASLCSIAPHVGSLGTLSSVAWYTANLAVFIPFRLARTILVTQMFSVNGTTASGDTDIGIYTADGTLLVSSGATAQSGTSCIQAFNITDTLVGPGLFYMAMSHSDATGTVMKGSGLGAVLSRVVGIGMQANAHPLPATFTLAAYTKTSHPYFGLTVRSVI
jgi:hypothetical protein